VFVSAASVSVIGWFSVDTQQLAFLATSCNLIHQTSIIPVILLDHLCYDLSVTDTTEAELR